MNSLSNIEPFIIKELLSNIDFCNRYLDKLESDYFKDNASKIIKCIQKYYSIYFKAPSVSILIKTLIPKLLKNDKQKIDEIESYLQDCISLSYEKDDNQWIEDEVKKFIKINKVKKALMKSVEFLEKGDADSAADVVLKASEVDFNDDLGIDYFLDLEKRINEFKADTSIIPTGHPSLDEVIGGGWRPKSLIIFGAPTNGGKTLILGHISFKLIEMGLNGLYITLEINKNILASRIDVNLTNISSSEYRFKLEDIKTIIHQKVKEREEKSKNDPQIKPYGRFIIKEACPNTFNANELLSLIKNLQLKRNFKPDFICIDYLGLMIPNGKAFSESTYGRLKTITEEVRQIAMVYNIPIFSAVQVNREGYNTPQIGIEKIADSMGIAHTADLAILVSKDPEDDSKMIWNIAKSRWSKNNEIIEVSVDYDHMRIITESDLEKKKIDMSKQLLEDFVSQLNSERE